tara:strand:+ start:6364 stop:7785 length:1422 start_codon:yes stop_codon:yes gene_type:complete
MSTTNLSVIEEEELKESVREIDLDILKKFKIKSSLLKVQNQEIETISFPRSSYVLYRKEGGKDIKVIGSTKGSKLFGQDLFSKSDGNIITIVEGDYDAPSMVDILRQKDPKKRMFPVVSVSSVSQAKADIQNNLEYFDQFEKIIIFFDNDEPGRKATEQVVSILPPEKTFIFDHDPEKTELKDANDYLTQKKTNECVRRWWNAAKLELDGVVTSVETYREWLKEEVPKSIAEYPYPTLQEMLKGLRLGELILLTAAPKVGKSTFMRQLEYEVLKQTEFNIGHIYFEDPKYMKLYGLMNVHAGKRFHLEEHVDFTEEEKEEAFQKTFGTGRIKTLDNFGTYEMDKLIQRVEYMIRALDCKFIFLDHITIVVGEEADDRKTLDRGIHKLRSLCNDYDASIVIISHTNDEGRTRSSRALEQLCDTWIELGRNYLDESEEVRNRVDVTIRANRFVGPMGPAGHLVFNEDTGRMKELE